MAIERIACPSCGAPLDVSDDSTIVNCRFCGTTLHLNFGPPPKTGIEPDGTIRDPATNRGLFTGKWPSGWRVTFANLDMHNDTSRPYVPRVGLINGRGSTIVVLLGSAGIKRSAAYQGMMAMYGGHLAGIDRTNYADMPDPVSTADEAARAGADNLGGTGFRLAGQLALQGIGQRQQQALAEFQRYSAGVPISDPFVAEPLRVFDFDVDGVAWKSVGFARLRAVRADIAAGATQAVGGLFSLFGQAFGQNRQAQPMGQGAPAGGWRTHDQAAYSRSGTIVWEMDVVATLLCPAAEFDGLFDGFIQVLLTARAHSDILNLTMQMQNQQDAAVQASTQSALARQQAAFQAQQAAHRQVQAAFDAKNASWQAASDAHHQAFRERTNAPFTGGGSAAPDFSEAIRSVNTYVTSDGREVEISVAADRAWENQAGDVIGTPGSFEPGADWIEIPRQ